MKWYNYPMFYKTVCKIKNCTPDKLEALIYSAPEATVTERTNSVAQVRVERAWEDNGRPYYDLYPSVIEAFTKIDLDGIKCDHIKLPLPQLMVRCQVGHEIPGSTGACRCFLVAASHMKDSDLTGLIISACDGLIMDDFPVHTVNAFALTPGQTIKERLKVAEKGSSVDDPIDRVMVDNVYRIIIALCLLKDNKDLIEAEPLEADRKKWEDSHDPKLLEKAAKRGKRAWSIGKHIETAPGFRRPHFAIRWMGSRKAKDCHVVGGEKHGLEPVLRPIKGCLVRRQKLEEVPTGYLDIQLVGEENA